MSKVKYSNRFLEAIKAKIRYKDTVELIYIPAKKSADHRTQWLWHNLVDNTINDFYAGEGYSQKWYDHFLFRGYIRTRPYALYEKWNQTEKWN